MPRAYIYGANTLLDCGLSFVLLGHYYKLNLENIYEFDTCNVEDSGIIPHYTPGT